VPFFAAEVYLAVIELQIPIEKTRFVVVDVETTGGTNGDHRMIELAFCVVEDGEIVLQYSSLINPHQDIPDFITVMTGITQSMVKDAPDEDEALAVLLSELCMPNAVFVAHNVGFDWRFIREGILRMGESLPTVYTLCTCKLSRRLNTTLPKHNLAAVAAHFGIENTARHRALGDAEATAKALIAMTILAETEHDATMLHHLADLQYASRAPKKGESKLKKLLSAQLNDIPEEAGVYYFFSAQKSLLYVGKAKNLRRRVQQYVHSGRHHSNNITRMVKHIREIRWETTGTELSALLLESSEIKRKKPMYNVASREYSASCFLHISDDAFPVLQVRKELLPSSGEYYGPFRSERMASRIAEMLIRTFQLRTCQSPLQPNVATRPCFEFHVKHCLAPCAELQSREHYNAMVASAKEFLHSVHNGAVQLLVERMEEASSELQYERAAMFRDGIREIERVTLYHADVPLAVSKTDAVLCVPTEDNYKTMEIFVLCAGRLIMQRTIGMQQPTQQLAGEIQLLFSTTKFEAEFSDKEIDELRIITSWIYQHRDERTVIPPRTIYDGSLAVALQHMLRQERNNIQKDGQEQNEYSQLVQW
jgi:DNA polymerase III subunit epsilon